MSKRIALAAVAGAHGVQGELRLKLFGDSAESLSHHSKVYVGGVERRLLSVRDGVADLTDGRIILDREFLA